MPIRNYHSHCPLDCPDTCALEIQVQNGRVSKISGADNGHPNTNGFICSKVRRFDRRLYHPDRLLYPMRRSGPRGKGEFERISWDEALSEIVEQFRRISSQYGGEAIFPFHYGGSNGYLTDEFIDDYFFARLGASRCQKTLCAAPSTAVAAAMYGKMPGVAFESYPQAQFILIWGANPKISNIHLMPYLKVAKRRGAFIAVVDQVNHFSGAEIDLHLPVLPGGDLPLALAMIQYWREHEHLDHHFLDHYCRNTEPLLEAAREWPLEKAAAASGVSAEHIRQLAEQYAHASPAVLRCGWGVERNRRSVPALTAILAMPALLGKFGLPGGGYTMSNSGAVSLDVEALFGPLNWNSRTLNQTRLGDYLGGSLDPPVKALFVYNCNPAVTVPDQNKVLAGLRREDLFTVVFEQVMTDTARFADILLPAATFLEHYDLRRGYGSYMIGGIRPVVSARGEARSNPAVFAELGRRMGWDDLAFRIEEDALIEDAVAALRFRGDVPDDLHLLKQGRTVALRFQGSGPVLFKTVFPRTEDGKVNLFPEKLTGLTFDWQAPDPTYPLALISPSHKGMITSTLGEFNCLNLSVTIHPEDARTRNIPEWASVRVFNELGEVHCHAHISRSIRPGVVMMPKGAWRKASINKKTSTALCPDWVEPVSGGACFNDARVEIELLPATGE